MDRVPLLNRLYPRAVVKWATINWADVIFLVCVLGVAGLLVWQTSYRPAPACGSCLNWLWLNECAEHRPLEKCRSDCVVLFHNECLPERGP